MSELVADRVRLTEHGIQVHTGKVDIGQRISTAMARIAAAELTVPLAMVTVAPVSTTASPNEGITSGSNSIETSGDALRRAAATLKAHLLRLAARRLNRNADDLILEAGEVVHPGSGRRLHLLDLRSDVDLDLEIDPDAAPAASLEDVPTGPPFGMQAMVTGAYVYVHDLKRPGMRHARTVRPPRPHARLEAIDAAVLERLDREGVAIIRDGSFLAVAAAREWQTVQAAERLGRACRWTRGEPLDERPIAELLRENPRVALPVVNGKPEQAPVPEMPAGPTYAASFTRSYQMHGALAPSAAMAEWVDGQLRIWTHSQGIYPLRASIAEALNLPVESVVIEHAPGSGCYGHNGADDAAFEAALIALALPGQPVLLKWTRADEHGWEPYAPAMLVDVAVGTGPDGKVAWWSQEAFSDSHRGRPRPGADGAGPRRLIANRLREPSWPAYAPAPNMSEHAGLHRNLDPIYAFSEKRLVKNLVRDLPLRVSAMRCLGGAANTFAIESAMDDLALSAGADPIAFRLAQLDEARGRQVLERLQAELAKLPETAPPAGRGIAYGQYKNRMTRVAVAVDLRVTDAVEVVLDRAVIVADPGRAIDPDGLRAQLEGGFMQAASWALYERVSYDRDGVQSLDWETYRVLRFDNVPMIQVVLIDAPGEKPLGAGEAAPGPTLAAIGNAIFACTGLRARALPFDREYLVSLALAE